MTDVQARTVLNQQEQERYLVLGSLTTDTGRGRAWLRWAGRAGLGWRRKGEGGKSSEGGEVGGKKRVRRKKARD